MWSPSSQSGFVDCQQAPLLAACLAEMCLTDPCRPLPWHRNACERLCQHKLLKCLSMAVMKGVPDGSNSRRNWGGASTPAAAALGSSGQLQPTLHTTDSSQHLGRQRCERGQPGPGSGCQQEGSLVAPALTDIGACCSSGICSPTQPSPFTAKQVRTDVKQLALAKQAAVTGSEAAEQQLSARVAGQSGCERWLSKQTCSSALPQRCPWRWLRSVVLHWNGAGAPAGQLAPALAASCCSQQHRRHQQSQGRHGQAAAAAAACDSGSGAGTQARLPASRAHPAC